VLARGKSLYETNCASCHAADLRGTADGKNPNLLRSGTALSDKQGEQIGAAVTKHVPAINLIAADSNAIAEYIHSIHATMGGQGSPPGRNPTNVELNVLVGDPAAGQVVFGAACST
jgi:cytochrome c oxidase cbb3-type subunit 3